MVDSASRPVGTAPEYGGHPLPSTSQVPSENEIFISLPR